MSYCMLLANSRDSPKATMIQKLSNLKFNLLLICYYKKMQITATKFLWWLYLMIVTPMAKIMSIFSIFF